MKIKNPFLRCLVPPVLFLVMQAIVGLFAAIAVIIMRFISSHTDGDILSMDTSFTPTMLAWVLILSGALTCLVLWRWRLIRLPEAFTCRGNRLALLCLAVFAAIVGIVATDLMSEQLALPNLFGEQMKEMAYNFWGILAIALIGPIIEEVTFREGVQGILLRAGKKPWVAAVFSALCFGIIHGNPAQIPFAFLVGIILAVIYDRTRNIVTTSLIHILNNSIAVVEIHMLGDNVDDFRYDQFLGLDTWMVWLLIAVLAIGCAALLRAFYVSHPSHISYSSND